VNENNVGAVEFYKSFNFKIDRTVPGYYENGDGAILMYIKLNSG
jgi:ribosomal-protein-alanine N-acetyltransferase